MCAVVFLSAAHVVYAGINTWTHLGPGRAVSAVRTLAIDPSTPGTLYAGTDDGGVFKTTDSGGTWRAANMGLTTTTIQALAIDPSTSNTLYAGTSGGTSGGGVFKSTDSGGTWSAANTGLTFLSYVVYAFAIDPSMPSTLYAGTSGDGVFKSTDSGATWGAVNTGLPYIPVLALAIDPSTPSTLYAGTSGRGVFKSTDSGSTWRAANTGLTATDINALAIDPSTPGTLYAGTSDGGVFTSTDSGGSWRAANIGPTATDVRTLALDLTTPGTLYVGTHDGGVFTSTDSGATWRAANTGLTATDVRTLVLDPTTSSTLYAGTSGFGGVFKSKDSSGSWTAASAGLLTFPNYSVHALAIDPTTPSTVYAGASNGDYGASGMFKSTDSGGSWRPVALNNVLALAIDPSTPSTLFAGTYGCSIETCYGVVFKSTDSGDTWSDADTWSYADTGPDGDLRALAIDPSTSSTLYAGTTFGVFKSMDGGDTWSAANTGLPDRLEVNALAIDRSAPSTLYAGLFGGGIFKSTDSGGTWRAANTGLTTTYVEALAIDPTAPSTLYVGTDGGVFESTDSGGTWNRSPINTGLTNTSILALAIAPTMPSTLYAGTDTGVFSIQQVAACTGDCDASGTVTVDEIITLVNIALGNAQPSACPNNIPSGAEVNIALIIQAVNAALSSCPSIDLYVAASGDLNGDGSVANPYRRITDAVVRARAERQTGGIPPEEVIRIHVAPGTYIGSFSQSALQNHPEYEVLPIILNVPRLAVLGSTVLVRDDRGLPTGSEPGSETIVEPDQSLRNRQSLFLVTRTADGAVGNGITVDGFVLDGKEGPFGNSPLYADRVSDFRISNNVIQGGSFGVTTRLASGIIEGNLLTHNDESGSTVYGGSIAQPATVVMRANRVTGNGGHGFQMLAVAPNNITLQRGSNTLDLPPLQTKFDRNRPEDLPNIPDTLAATLSENDISDYGIFGIRFAAVQPEGGPFCLGRMGYDTQDDNQPVTAVLTATVLGNTINGNGLWGLGMEAGFPCRSDPRALVVTFAGSFEGNSFVGRTRPAALFDFTRADITPSDLPTYGFTRASTYQVTDVDGELAGFDYDNPLTDRLDGAVLNNTLTVNGVEVSHGVRVMPQTNGARIAE